MTNLPWEDTSPQDLARRRAETASSPWNVLTDGLARYGYAVSGPEFIDWSIPKFMSPKHRTEDYLYFFRTREKTRAAGHVRLLPNKLNPDPLDSFSDDWRYVVVRANADETRDVVYEGTDMLEALRQAAEVCWLGDLADAKHDREELEKTVPLDKLPVVDWTDRSIGGPVTKRTTV